MGDKVKSYSGFTGTIVNITWRSAAGSTCCYIDSVEVKTEDGMIILSCPKYLTVINENDK